MSASSEETAAGRFPEFEAVCDQLAPAMSAVTTAVYGAGGTVVGTAITRDPVAGSAFGGSAGAMVGDFVKDHWTDTCDLPGYAADRAADVINRIAEVYENRTVHIDMDDARVDVPSSQGPDVQVWSAPTGGQDAQASDWSAGGGSAEWGGSPPSSD